MLGTLVLLFDAARDARAPMRWLIGGLIAFVALPPAAAAGWTWPVHGPVIARFAYARANPFARGQRRGVDIAAPRGTPLVAACAGRVRFAGTIGTSGRTVSVACGRYLVSYLHLDGIAVRGAAPVRVGDPIGTVGTTGRRNEARPHVSFGVRRASDRWGYVDPLRLLPRERGVPPDVAPLPRHRPTPDAPLGRAPAPEHRPVAAPAAHPAPSLSALPAPSPSALPAGATVAASLPLGRLWLPAGTVLVLVAAAAPLATLRVRRGRRRRSAPRPEPDARPARA